MTSPGIISVTIVVFCFLYFLYLGVRNRRFSNTNVGYFRANGAINAKGLGDTIAAAGLSNAAVALAYVTLAPVYGLLMFLAICANVASIFLTRYVVVVSKIEIGEITTIGNLARERVNSKRLAILCEAITSLGFLSALLVEMIIGAVLFQAAFPDLPFAEYLGFLIVSLVVLSYIAMGGLATTIGSDSWQLRLILVGALSLLVTSVTVLDAPAEITRSIGSSAVFGAAKFYDVIGWLTVTFILSFFAPIGQLSNWQRLSSTKKVDRRAGLNRGIVLMFILYLIFFSAGQLFYFSGFTVQGWGDVFRQMEDFGGLFSQVLFPMLFVGLVAAVISTADTNALAIVFSLFSNRVKTRAESEPLDRRLVLQCVSGIFAVLLLFFLAYQWLEDSNTLLAVIFVFFGLHVLLAPLVYCLLTRSGGFREPIFFYGIAVALLVVLLFGAIAVVTNTLPFTYLGNTLGFVIASSAAWIGIGGRR